MNPEINVGTGSMDRERWSRALDDFMSDLRAFDFMERSLDVRENVNFRGRNLAEFVHTLFPESGCGMAIEVKKFFMDEWTGLADSRQTSALLDAFRSTVPGILRNLNRL